MAKAKRLGKPIIYLEWATSTQDVVREAALKGMQEGFTVVAERLEHARGRMGRPFYTTKGGLYFSILLRPRLRYSQLSTLPLALGVAVAKSIEEEGLKCALKWPNDCIINSKKVCGILVESESVGDNLLYAIAGVGLNANIPLQQLPEALRSEATTIQHELKRQINLTDMLQRILSHFEYLYDNLQQEGSTLIIKEWSERDILSGKLVKIEKLDRVFEARVKGVSNEGLLIVEYEQGLVEMSSADIKIHTI
ncbi:MAG: biotin--[acetyl-CoA-carboxylase] ligase [Nitrososphaerales archaeon]